MKRKICVAFSIFLLILLQVSVNSASPAISAKHAVLIDADTGEVLFEKDGNTRVPMASTTKIATAIAVIEALPLDKEIAVPRESVGVEGTSAYLKEGESLTVCDLLHALLLSSANDAAVTLAIATDGSLSAFSERMNRLCDRIGLKDTHFENPHGLPSEGHYTTAHELAVLSAYAMHNPIFAQIVCKKSYSCQTSITLRTFRNHNKLLNLSKDAVGIKTGFTKKSGRCLVGAAEKEGAHLISVTLSAPNDWNDHLSLFHYGFSLLGISDEAERS